MTTTDNDTTDAAEPLDPMAPRRELLDLMSQLIAADRDVFTLDDLADFLLYLPMIPGSQLNADQGALIGVVVLHLRAHPDTPELPQFDVAPAPKLVVPDMTDGYQLGRE